MVPIPAPRGRGRWRCRCGGGGDLFPDGRPRRRRACLPACHPRVNRRTLVLDRARVGPVGRRTAQDEPAYEEDIPNLGNLSHPDGVAHAALPLTLQALCHVPVLVSSRRSALSGSPTHVVARLWVE